MQLEVDPEDVLQQPGVKRGQGGVLQHPCTQDRRGDGQPGRAGDQGRHERPQVHILRQRADPSRRQVAVRLGGARDQGAPAPQGREPQARREREQWVRGEVAELGQVRLLGSTHTARAEADGRTEEVPQTSRSGHQLIPGKDIQGS